MLATTRWGGGTNWPRRVIAGQRIFARLDRAPAELRTAVRLAQPNYFLPLDKAGIDLFSTAYPVRSCWRAPCVAPGACTWSTTTAPPAWPASTPPVTWPPASSSPARSAAAAATTRRGPSPREPAATRAARFAVRRGIPGSDSGVRPRGTWGCGPPVRRALTAPTTSSGRCRRRSYRWTATTSAPVRARRRSLGVLDQLWRDTPGSLTGTGNGALKPPGRVRRWSRTPAGCTGRRYPRGVTRPAPPRRPPRQRPDWQRRILIDGLDEVRTETAALAVVPDGRAPPAAHRHRRDEVAA